MTKSNVTIDTANTSTVVALHPNVKLLASTYSPIALTMAMEDIIVPSEPALNWNDIDSIKAVIVERVTLLNDLKLMESEKDSVVARDHFDMMRAATTQAMMLPLKAGTAHEMMDEYFDRVNNNEKVKEVLARGNISDNGRSHFEACKVLIANY